MSLDAGTAFGPYTIVGLIAKGGMGEVYRAEDQRLGRSVAIKVLPQDLVKTPEMLRRFQQEARTLAALSHPNIVTIFDVGIERDSPFVVMELLDGEDLGTCLKRSSLSPKQTLEIATSVAEGLRSAHAAGIIHRDLKPQNILLTSAGTVKILDFGLARWQRPERGDYSEAETHSAVVAGTVPYMSPEQLRGQPLDERTDIFSFGCVLYEMVTGKSPFARSAAAETISAILNEEPSLPGKISPDLANLILHCLEKDPDRRFQAAQDVILFLKNIGTGFERRPKSKSRHQTQSIAILPFENTSGDPHLDYLSEGITEALINSLSQLPRLKVMARGTVFHYRGKRIEPLEAGRQLNVNAVLTGRVVQQADRLLIGTELMDVQNGWHLWGEQFNCRGSDVFVLQSEIAAEISTKLRLKLSPKEKKLLSKHYTENTDAYQAYLKGRYFWNRRTREHFQKAIEHFTRAIEIDPLYALAYAGLADTYALMADFGILLQPKDAFAKSRGAAMKALDIDPALAEAHTSLAHLRMHEFRWADAEREFKKSLQLNPGYATARHWYFMCLTMIGRREDSFEEMKKAEELDPLSLIIQTDIAACYYFNDELETAAQRLQKVLELDPNFASARRFLTAVYEQLDMYSEAIREYEKARISAGNDPQEVAMQTANLRTAYDNEGVKGYWKQRFAQTEKQRRGNFVSLYTLAQIHASLGDQERALDLLEQARTEPAPSMIYLKVDPRFKTLRSDPRFINLLHRIGL